MNIRLKDGSIKEFDKPLSGLEIAVSISEGLARVACAVLINNEVADIRTEINADCDFNVLTFDSDEGKRAYRHTTSHILAYAVKRLYPEAKLAIGPAIEDGFYYDFDTEKPFTPSDIEKLEAEMKKIVKEELPITRFSLSREDALHLMQEHNESYKIELINALPEGEEISFYQMGSFVDLCAGPHLMNTKYVKAFKLTSAAGAYWRGDSKNKMLNRIYGTAFTKKADLDEYITQVEEAKKRDHNKIGRDLGYFTTVEAIGQGLPLLMPKGAKVFQILQRFVEDEEESRGYVLTKTPYMAKSDLYMLSGHWEHYKDGMFILGDKEKDDVMALRPMTCPFQFMIYNAGQKSYRDLPIRYGETSTLFRNEDSGEMHGLIRVRQFTLSEGHIVCTPEQLEQEFFAVVDLINYFMKTLGIFDDVSYRFSKWDPNNKEKYIDNPQAWENSQQLMKKILDKLELNYKEADDEAAFYGPKLDIQFKNVHGKEDTLITIQIDFALAERLSMSYIDKDGQKKAPMVIHRSSIGCYERTIAMLLEKYAGALPAWIAPTQVKLMPISDKFNDYANTIYQSLKKNNIRVEADYRAEKIGYKIREAQMDKVPYMIIVGEKEQQEGLVAVRSRKEGDLGSMSPESFIAKISEEVQKKI